MGRLRDRAGATGDAAGRRSPSPCVTSIARAVISDSILGNRFDIWSLPNRRGEFAHSARVPAGGRWTGYNGLMSVDNVLMSTDKRLMSTDKRLMSTEERLMSADNGCCPRTNA